MNIAIMVQFSNYNVHQKTLIATWLQIFDRCEETLKRDYIQHAQCDPSQKDK